MYDVKDNRVEFNHPDNQDVSLSLDVAKRRNKDCIDEERLNKFLSTKYVLGQAIIRQDYAEVVVGFTNLFDVYDEESIIIEPCGENLETKAFYEISDISEDFDLFLSNTIHWDNFSSEYFKSIKVYNIKQIITDEYRSDEFKKKLQDVLEIISFQLSTKHNLKIRLIDLSDADKFEPDFDEVDTSEIESTIISNSNYDLDLVSYFNQATHMSDSSFRYLAFFQVLECLFDEVYREETIQDAKSIINSNWFNTRNSDHILQLIKLIEKFSKDQNDRSKIRLILDKYFKMDMHDEAFLLAYSDISEIMKSLNLIKEKDELKDLQKIGNIIYDIRCEYTHSNRNFPKRNETKVKKEHLTEHIEIIRLISQAIVENYRKK